MTEEAHQRHRYLRRKRGAPTGIGDRAEFVEAVAEAMDEEETRRARLAGRTETLAAIVLSLAAVATAWSAYQSTRWSGEMAEDYNQAAAYRTESVRASNEADERTGVAVTLEADWLSAQLSGDQVFADALRTRMPQALDEAMRRWLGDWQPGQPIPPGDPFTNGDYNPPEAEKALALEQQAEAAFAEGRDANQYSDNYVLTGVVFALALFFAGVASKFGQPQNAVHMVYAAAALLTVGCVLLLLQPKSIGV